MPRAFTQPLPLHPPTLSPQIRAPTAAAFAEAAGAGRLARFSGLHDVGIGLGALDALSDTQADGLAAGLATLSSLVSLSVFDGDDDGDGDGDGEQAPLTGPVAVASRLSLLLHGTTNLKELSLWWSTALSSQPPVRPRCRADSPSPAQGWGSRARGREGSLLLP